MAYFYLGWADTHSIVDGVGDRAAFLLTPLWNYCLLEPGVGAGEGRLQVHVPQTLKFLTKLS